MATYRHRAVVSGKGQFPVDMLRYEQCWPDSDCDAHAIAGTLQRWENLSPAHALPAKITVAKFNGEKRPSWTTARWKSFGWTVKVLDDERRG